MNQLKAKGMTAAMLGVDDWNVTKAMQLYDRSASKLPGKKWLGKKP